MDKLLEHARLVHLTLITLCCALVVFVAAGTTFRETSIAIRSLEALRDIDTSEFERSIAQAVKSGQDKSGFSDRLRSFSEQSGIRIAPWHFKYGEDGNVWIVKDRIKNATLSQLQLYLNSDPKIEVATSDVDSLLSILASELPKYRAILTAHPDSFRLRFFSPSNRPDWTLRLSWPANNLEYPGNTESYEDLPTPRTHLTQLGTLSIRGLLVSQLQTSDPLAQLALWWPQLKDQPIDKALLYLKLIQAGEDEKLDVLGIKVRAQQSALAGSTAIALLMLYLLAQIRQVADLARGGVKIDSTAPWFALYRDRLSSLCAYLSITVLPLAALTFVQIMTFDRVTGKFWIATVPFLIVVACSLNLAKSLRAARSLS